jgi:predicted RNA-binding Zn-ribbon protein involved in translation (DUF1610 family)
VQQVEKFLNHFLGADLDTKKLAHQLGSREDVQERVMELPVCPKCERVAFRDTRKNDPVRRFITCPNCGYHGPTNLVLAGFLKEGYHKDTSYYKGAGERPKIFLGED